MTVYVSKSSPAKLVAVLKFGTARILSKHFEYFQALTLGNNNLLGFRNNRYQGSAASYASVELRVKLFDLDSYTLAGPFGLIGFYETGRVKLKGESSKGLHSAFGGGFYFVPFNLFVISASAGFSESDRVVNFSIGTKVNITY
jgi:hemolysin activation/secretion protein